MKRNPHDKTNGSGSASGVHRSFCRLEQPTRVNRKSLFELGESRCELAASPSLTGRGVSSQL